LTRFIKTRRETKKKDSLQSTVKCKLKSKKSNKRQQKVKSAVYFDVEPNKPTNRLKCRYYKCKKKAIGQYTVDIDIPGLPYCKIHKNDIGSAILWTILGVEELAQHSMGVPPPKKRNKK